MGADPCPGCGELFFPGQRFYVAPKKEHVQCRKVRELGLEVGALLHERHEASQAPRKDSEEK